MNADKILIRSASWQRALSQEGRRGRVTYTFLVCFPEMPVGVAGCALAIDVLGRCVNATT